MTDRRAFLKFLASSPLFASIPSISEAFAQTTTLQGVDNLIGSAADALDVFDFEPVARKAIPPAHWGYMSTGVDGEETLRANREAYSRYQLRTRRFVDVSKMDMSVELFGTKFNSPILLCPVGGQKAFYLQGEVAVAKAAKARGQLQILSTVTSSSVEDVIEARGGPTWYQLYTTNSFDVTTKLVKRAEAAGCPAVAVTVDLPGGRNTETATRLARVDTRNCTSCHGPAGSDFGTRPMFKGIDTKGLNKLKLLDLGLHQAPQGRHENESAHQRTGHARGCRARRAEWRRRNYRVQSWRARDGNEPWNPRSLAGSRAGGPWTDSGVHRWRSSARHRCSKGAGVGCDSRWDWAPYIWGLGAFGQPGVDRVLEILNNELRLAMVGVGARSVREISSASIMRRS